MLTSSDRLLNSKQIEERYGLSSGAVRQYIRNHPELIVKSPETRGFFKVGNSWACFLIFAHEIWGLKVIETPLTIDKTVVVHELTGATLTFSKIGVVANMPNGLTNEQIARVQEWQAIITEALTGLYSGN